MNLIIKEKNNISEQESLITTSTDNDEFSFIMSFYKIGLDNAIEEFTKLKKMLNEYYGYDMITNITGRIKTPESIINKMKKKKYELKFENLIEKIDDIAGIRIVCSFKDDIYKIKNIISQMDELEIIKEKDYIKNPKKSGYSAYHIIVCVPVHYKNQIVYTKVEVQIRTMLMDFWASAEHKIKYKSNTKLSRKDSKKLLMYAKIINSIGDDITKIYRKQNCKSANLLN